jgi:hypothetical protein
MRHRVYSVIYSVAPINSSLLTITLCYSVGTTLVCNDTKYIVVSCRYDRVRLYLLMLSSLYSSVFGVLESIQRYTVRDRRHRLHAMCILMRGLVYNFVLPLSGGTGLRAVTSKPRPTEPMTAAWEAFKHSNLYSPIRMKGNLSELLSEHRTHS